MGNCSSSSSADSAQQPRKNEPRSAALVPVPDAKPKSPSTIKDFKLGEELGSGAYSKVYRAYLKSDPSKAEVALKITEKKQLSPEDVVGIHQEAEIMRSFSHPNIVSFYSFFEDKHYFYASLEIIQGGQLYDRIAAKHNYNENEARELIQILLSAIDYCHQRGVAHRDLKPENLLMSSKSDDAHIKIADFGFAKRCPTGDPNGLLTQLGTPAYIAPEIICHKKYGVAVDMWSIGVIIYTMISGSLPFDSDKQKDLFHKIKHGKYSMSGRYWDKVDQSCKDLVAGLLTVDPQQRLTASEALRNPWLHDTSNAADLSDNLSEFKKFNGLRKFKNATKLVILMNRMKPQNHSNDLEHAATDDAQEADNQI